VPSNLNIITSHLAFLCLVDDLHNFQAEGIAKAKGVYAKRGASINRERIRELQKERLTITAIARALDISRMSVYRINKQN